MVTGDIMRRDAELSIIELCRSGLDPESLRARLLPRLRRAVPADGLWWATVDPATLLFTGTYQEEIPERTKPYFLENEFVADDVNKWVDVARYPGGVRTLEDATGGVWSRSARYSEIFEPLGFGDELRAVFSVQGACSSPSASTAKAGTRSRRRTRSSSNESHRTWRSGSAPGLSWGRSTPRMWPGHQALSSSAPNCPWSAGRRLRSNGSTSSGTRRTRTHCCRLSCSRSLRVWVARRTRGLLCLNFASEPGRAGGRAACVALANRRWQRHRSDHRERIGGRGRPDHHAGVRALRTGAHGHRARLSGMSTSDIATRAGITVNTVQDHLKSVFNKVGVRSRRELVVQVFRDHYAPGARAGRRIGTSGYFA